MDDLKKIYLEEMADLLDALEQSLLTLETAPDDQSLIDEIFRSMHTIKGSSSMFGMTTVADFVHNLETLYSELRDGSIKISKEIISCTLGCGDHISKIIEDSSLAGKEINDEHQELTKRVLAFLATKTEVNVVPKSKEGDMNLRTYHIYFKPPTNIFEDGTNPLFLLEELCMLGKYKTFAHISNFSSIENFDVVNCYTSWDVILSTKVTENKILDIFLFVESTSELEVNLLSEGDVLSIKKFTDGITYDGLASSRFSFSHLVQLVKDAGIDTEHSTEPKYSDLDESSNSIDSDELVKEVATAVNEKSKSISSIRVSSDKLDELMNQVSELVTTQAGLSLYAQNNFSPELEAISENVEKLSRQLRDITFGMTLIEINHLFGRFQRVVRDLSGQLSKSVNFITEGGETELDKTIIESLTDPLMHLIRNSLDHGIESKEERVRKGKPEKGTIKLKAYYSGASVYIQIEDDGKGLDLVKIRTKAIEKKLIGKEEVLSDKELMELIFAPGFSTAQSVTDLSGRGVGMDVVRRNILDIRGDISIDSTKDVGTKITLGLPLTLSIIDGLLVMVQGTYFVIPLSVVDKCYEVKREQLENEFNQLLVLDDVQIPFLDLRNEFTMNNDIAPHLASVILIENEEKKVGICVDSIVGEYQAVLKAVGKYYRDQEFISGATILGDGTIALVLDTYKIIEQKTKIKTLAI